MPEIVNAMVRESGFEMCQTKSTRIDEKKSERFRVQPFNPFASNDRGLGGHHRRLRPLIEPGRSKRIVLVASFFDREVVRPRAMLRAIPGETGSVQARKHRALVRSRLLPAGREHAVHARPRRSDKRRGANRSRQRGQRNPAAYQVIITK